MYINTNVILSALFCSLAALSCSRETKNDNTSEQSGPLATARELLRLHGLLGKRPDQRSEEDKKKPVDHAQLKALIADLDSEDRFLTDLYVGFVSGALAKNQNNLTVEIDNNRAAITTGNLEVKLKKIDNKWKIVLLETIPVKIKEKARQEKARLGV